MHYDAIDSVLFACTDLEAACAPYRRLGLTIGSISAGQRVLRVGDFAVYLMADTGPPLDVPLKEAQAEGRALFGLALRVADLEGTTAVLRARGIEPAFTSAALAWLPLREQAGMDLVLVQQADLIPAPAHAFGLRRLDHLATIARDLEAVTRFWVDVLGVPVAGEVTTPTLVIRQLKIGDAVLELLGAASETSPLHQRPAGLVSMASWEVADLDQAVQQARTAGFTAADAAPGPLPGTRITTIQGSELSGVNMQLLQYMG